MYKRNCTYFHDFSQDSSYNTLSFLVINLYAEMIMESEPKFPVTDSKICTHYMGCIIKFIQLSVYQLSL